MLVHGEQVRLTPRERKVLFRLTGIDPRFIKTRRALRLYTEHYLSDRPTDSVQIQLIKTLLRKHLPLH